MTRNKANTMVVGTRASKLAMWQTNYVVSTLCELFPGLQCRVQTFKTVGDDIVDRPLPELGGKGVFTARLERALLSGDVDVAVHSLKDLPIENTPGLTLGAITVRADARDILVTRDGAGLDDLPPGAVVGTSSLRRQAQLLRVRPDLVMRPIRGNVETRIRKVMDGEYDATVLAAAGMDRLELSDEENQRLSFDVMLPAPGQGAIAIQCREDDQTTLERLKEINHPGTRDAVMTERAFLSSLGGGCAAPVAAYAIGPDQDGRMVMTGLVARPDGSEAVQVDGADADGVALGASLAEDAISRGARSILDDARLALEGKLPLQGKRIVVTRAAGQGEDLCHALSGLGATPVRLPMIRIVPLVEPVALLDRLSDASPGDWVVFTSANGVSAVWDAVGDHRPGTLFAGLKVAAVGPKTAHALAERSVTPDFVPESFTGAAAADGMPDVSDRRVWLLRAETAGRDIVNVLVSRGADVEDISVYRTEGEPIDPATLGELEKGVDVITFTSGSTARHFKSAWESAGKNTGFLKDTVIACIGPVTARTATDLGFNVAIVAGEHTTSGLVDALATHFSEVSR